MRASNLLLAAMVQQAGGRVVRITQRADGRHSHVELDTDRVDLGTLAARLRDAADRLEQIRDVGEIEEWREVWASTSLVGLDRAYMELKRRVWRARESREQGQQEGSSGGVG